MLFYISGEKGGYAGERLGSLQSRRSLSYMWPPLRFLFL